MSIKPLDEIKVVELTNFVAAPIAGRFLAEWGAEVVKVETINGDPVRSIVGASWGVPEKWRTTGHDIGFDLANWNKQFVSINLKDDDGRAFLHRLISRADVFITNYRAQALNSMKLDYESLKQQYPSLVYAHLVGYGENGEEADRAAFDNTSFAARGGICDTFRQKDGVPPNIVGAFGDQICGAFLASGICAALLGRERTGKGDKVVVSLYGSAVFCTAYGIEQTMFEGVQSYPRNRERDNNPFLNAYKAKDNRWVQLNIPVYGKNFPKVMELIGRADLADHPVYSSIVKVNEQGKKPDVIQLLSEGFEKKCADEWVVLFTEAGLTIEKQYSSYEIAQDKQAEVNGFIVERTYPDGERMKLVQTPVKLYSVGIPDFVPTGVIGRDTDVFLKQCGYSDQESNDLRKKGAVR